MRDEVPALTLHSRQKAVNLCFPTILRPGVQEPIRETCQMVMKAVGKE